MQRVAIDQVIGFILKKEVIRCFVYLIARYKTIASKRRSKKPAKIFSLNGLSGFKKNLDLKAVVSLDGIQCWIPFSLKKADIPSATNRIKSILELLDLFQNVFNQKLVADI